MKPKKKPRKRKAKVKAVRAWASLDDKGHIEVVGTYTNALAIYKTKGGGLLLRAPRNMVRVLITVAGK